MVSVLHTFSHLILTTLSYEFFNHPHFTEKEIEDPKGGVNA